MNRRISLHGRGWLFKEFYGDVTFGIPDGNTMIEFSFRMKKVVILIHNR